MLFRAIFFFAMFAVPLSAPTFDYNREVISNVLKAIQDEIHQDVSQLSTQMNALREKSVKSVFIYEFQNGMLDSQRYWSYDLSDGTLVVIPSQSVTATPFLSLIFPHYGDPLLKSVSGHFVGLRRIKWVEGEEGGA